MIRVTLPPFPQWGKRPPIVVADSGSHHNIEEQGMTIVLHIAAVLIAVCKAHRLPLNRRRSVRLGS